jgi:hypothetical protein
MVKIKFLKILCHELIKYQLEERDIPNNITRALVSEIPIKTIAILVEELEITKE